MIYLDKYLCFTLNNYFWLYFDMRYFDLRILIVNISDMMWFQILLCIVIVFYRIRLGQVFFFCCDPSLQNSLRIHFAHFLPPLSAYFRIFRRPYLFWKINIIAAWSFLWIFVRQGLNRLVLFVTWHHLNSPCTLISHPNPNPNRNRLTLAG